MLQASQIQNYLETISRPGLPVADVLKRKIFMQGAWLLGIPAFVYGAIDRGITWFNSGTAEVTAFSHCMVATMGLLVWFVVGMAANTFEPPAVNEKAVTAFAEADLPPACIAQQSYRLPFPYQCQIYHLLNLKHLEEIHRFSLGNLKVTKVSHFKKTQTGGQMRFRTVLDSPVNVLRLWRDPSVEVDLILHTPQQIELKVPIYRQKFVHVLFSVQPLSEEEHTLSIQIFSDLRWPREMLRAILTIAASLTLLEDLPYLSQLASSNAMRSPHATEGVTVAPAMQLFQRYLHLYGDQPTIATAAPIGPSI